MKVVVFGATGMLGQALMAEGRARGYKMIGDRVELTDHEAICEYLTKHQPDLIINAAAITNLQACEDNPQLAYNVNALPLYWLSVWCQNSGAKLVQISSDQCAHSVLLNEYARTKAQGEKNALVCSSALVVRTNIVGLENTKWMLDAIAENAEITLFRDYYASSIDVWTFSKILFDLIEKFPKISGTVNIASRKAVNKCDFVNALADRLRCRFDKAVYGSARTIQPARSLNNELDVAEVEALLDRPMPKLRDVINALVEQAERRNLCLTPSESATG